MNYQDYLKKHPDQDIRLEEKVTVKDVRKLKPIGAYKKFTIQNSTKKYAK